MKKQMLYFILLSVSFLSCNKKEEKSSEILYNKTENETSKFLKKYDIIRLISYNKHRNVYTPKNELKIEKDTINIPNIEVIDNILLDKYFSKKIAGILLSTDKECSVADCYTPRHLILFYKHNKIVDFYEFCAECGGSRQSKNINFPHFCSDKGDKIIKVFKEMKLKNDGEDNGVDYKYY
ncbi:hypothetical protein ACSVH5_06265 [Flavobacterium sp. RSSA_27]|uniref:hypothetical protein n=1 Tax=Flavobacterium sp. RSSA_27 TaxID=3447667 RepID=UPI003F3331BD